MSESASDTKQRMDSEEINKELQKMTLDIDTIANDKSKNNATTYKNNKIIPGRTRIKDSDGYIGTIKYIGPVASSKKSNEIYAGIQWDDPTRGKHNGSVLHRDSKELVQHFTCDDSLASGSFLKLHKIDYGVELNSSLITSKYVNMNDELIAPNNILPHYITTCKGKEKKPIEFIGELKIRKQQQIDCINSISLRCLGISSISIFDDLILMEQLKSIDLAGNLLCDWDDVMLLLKQFQNLEKLSLASNRILDIQKKNEDKNESDYDMFYKAMKALNLNSCGIQSYTTIVEIDRIMPNLVELCLACNSIGASLDEMVHKSTSTISTSMSSIFFSNLTLLDCSNCNITSWETQIQCFAFLPKLSTLILDDNSIQKITSPSQNEKENYFPCLESMQLAGNRITSWIHLDALGYIPTLTSLRFRNNPITSDIGTGEARSIIIARLPNLAYVNASPVSEKERIESERRYVYAIIRDVLSQSSETSENNNKESIIKDSLSSIAKSHPRFESLFKLHHDSMLSLLHKNKNQILCQSGSLGSDVMNVTIKSMLPTTCSNNTLVKRLPATLSIGRLKILCGRAFDVNVEDLLLHFKANADDPFPIELDDDKNSLEYYGIYNGAEILVNEKEKF